VTETSKKDQLYELIRANSVLPERRPILCLGAANLDRKLRALGPLAMGSSNPARHHESFGGVARNIAENLARLGAPVALITAVGVDAAGAALLAQAHGLGIDTRGTLTLADACSGTYIAVLDHGGELALALADMALYDALTPEFLATCARQRAGAALVVADLNLPHDGIEALLAGARAATTPLVLVAVSEPKMARLPRDLRGLRLLILNEGELAARIGRVLRTDDDFAAACREVQAQGARDLVVTRGARGVLYTVDGGIAHLAAPPARIVDVTGAGDAFAAALCWSLGQGSADLALACRRGLWLAALTLATSHTVRPDLTPASLAGLPDTIDQD
jgi:pseudouridine kinase